MPVLSVIVPAYNERDNLGLLTAALASALDALQQFGVHWAPATMVGIVIGSIWNYTIAAQLVWRSTDDEQRDHPAH